MATTWLKALSKAGLEVRSAADALQVKGWLDTGNYALNWAISGRLLRGYPLGHTVEVFGDPGTGKSFLVTRALAMAQQSGGVALLDDTEGAYNLEHAARLGIDTEALAYRRSRTVKDHLKTAQAFIKAYREARIAGPGILALDSMAQLTTDHELETQLDKRDMTKAAELKAFFRIIAGDLFDLPVVHVSANHTIAAIGSMFQSRTTPGGGGPKFMASVRLDLRAINRIRVQADYTGVICRVVVDKNRFVAPWKEVRLAIPFEQAISRASGLLPLLTALGVLEERGQFLYRGKERIGRAYKESNKEKFLAMDDAAQQLLAAHPEILEETDHMLATGVVSQPPTTEPIIEESPDE